MTTISAPAYQVATRDVYGKEGCDAVVFAVTGGGRVLRAVIGGVEQNVDSSWSTDVHADKNTRREVNVRYLDPRSGAELACHRVSFTCVGEYSWRGVPDANVVTGAPCILAAPVGNGIDQSGSPRLVIMPVNRVMANQYVQTARGGFMVGSFVVVAEVRGQITEDWYCPGVEWLEPQTEGYSPSLVLRHYAEADCGAYSQAAAAKQERRITRRFTMPEGNWEIKLQLRRGDRIVAVQTTMVTVGTPGEAFGNRDGRGTSALSPEGP